MLDRDIIQNRGVENVVDNGTVVGFRFLIRNPNYRGTFGRLIDGIEVRIGDRHWPRDLPLWTLHGSEYTLRELRDSHLDVHWDLQTPAMITVPERGGLEPGAHELEVEIALHAPYIPAEFQPSLFPASRTVTVIA